MNSCDQKSRDVIMEIAFVFVGLYQSFVQKFSYIAMLILPEYYIATILTTKISAKPNKPNI
jgi:hypothetical protein